MEDTGELVVVPDNLPAGDSGNSPVASPAVKEPDKSGSATTQVPGDKGTGSQPQTVPLERFQEVDRELNRYRPLESIRDELDKDPSLIHDIRATIAQRGRPVQTQPAAAAAEPSADATMQKFIETMTPVFAENPIKGALAISSLVADKAVEKTAETLQSSIVSLAIAGFKADMRSHPMYGAAFPHFDRLVADIPAKDFRGMTEPQIRSRLAQEFLKAVGIASMDAYTKAVKEGKLTPMGEPPSPPNYSGSGSRGGEGKAGELTADEMRLAKEAGLDDADIQAMKEGR